MNGKTHRLGGICTGIATSSLLLQQPYNSDKLLVGGVLIAGSIIGSLLPDIDHKGSYMGSRHKITSSIVNNTFGHRGATHAPFVHIVMYLILLLLGDKIGGYPQIMYISFVTGLFVGGLSHLALDIITTAGIPLLYPFTKKKTRIMKLKAGSKDKVTGKYKKSNTEYIVNFLMISVTFLIVKGSLF